MMDNAISNGARRRKKAIFARLYSETSEPEDEFLSRRLDIQFPESPASTSDDESVFEEPTTPQPDVANELPGFFDYCWSELTSGYSLQNDKKRYSEKRRKLYALFQIPVKVESFLFFGHLQCIDAFLYLFTFLPIRFLISLSFVFRWKRWGSAEICDFLKVGIMACATAVMLFVDTSVVYHVVRSQGVIKLYIFYNMLEVADKLFSSLGQDILEALFWTASEPFSFRTVSRTLFHFFIATTYASFHTFLVLLQATTLNVAFNSHNQSLLAILMSNNFVELKGSVFKKFAKANLFQMTCSDVRERFHLMVLIAVVILRNMVAVNWSGEHFLELMPDVGMVLGAELLVDWLKHAFITKFNEINAVVYKDFSMTIAFDVVKNRDSSGAFNAYSDQVSRRMGFIPIPLSIMLIRVLTQTFTFTHPMTLGLSILMWLILLAVKIGNGIVVLGKACQQVADFRKLQSCARDQLYRQRLVTKKSKSAPSSPKMSLVDFTDVCHQPSGKQDLTASDVLDQLFENQQDSTERFTRRTYSMADLSRNPKKRSSKTTEDDLATVTAYTMLPPEQGVERIE